MDEITLLIIKNQGANTNFSHEFSIGLNYMNSDFEFNIQNGEFQIKELNGSAIFAISYENVTMRDDSGGTTGTPYTATSPIDLYNKLDALGYTPLLANSGTPFITGLISAGMNVTITGSGTSIDPYVINASTTGSTTYIVNGTNTTVSGDGSVGNPYMINVGFTGFGSFQEMYDDNPENTTLTDGSSNTVMEPGKYEITAGSSKTTVELGGVSIEANDKRMGISEAGFSLIETNAGTKSISVDLDTTSIVITDGANSSDLSSNSLQMESAGTAVMDLNNAQLQILDDTGDGNLTRLQAASTSVSLVQIINDGDETTDMNYSSAGSKLDYMKTSEGISATVFDVYETPDASETHTLTKPFKTGTYAMLDDIPDTADFVPYTGAASDVNLGDHNVTLTDGTDTALLDKNSIDFTNDGGSYGFYRNMAGDVISININNNLGNSVDATVDGPANDATVKVHSINQTEANLTANATESKVTLNSNTSNSARIIEDNDFSIGHGNYTGNETTTLEWPAPSGADFVQTLQARNGVVANLDQIPATYTDEQAQDAVGTILNDTATIDLTYTDATPEIKADVKDDSITNAKLANVATATIKGRTTAGAGDPEDLTPAQAKGVLGLPTTTTDNAIVRFDGTLGNQQNSGVIIDDDGGITFPGQASPTYGAKKIVYDTSNNCFTAYNDDSAVSLQIGQEIWIPVRNVSGSTIPNGSAVYINGANSGFPTIALAQANSGTTTVCAGLATESIANGANGFVTSLGLVRGLDTSLFSTGAVYLSSTVAGGITQTAPIAPNYRYRIGFVTAVSASVGAISVTPSTAALGNGTANQVFGMNAAGTAQEVKTISGVAPITVTNGANSIAIGYTSPRSFMSLNSNYTLTSQTTLQKAFNVGASSGGAFSAGTRLYYFEGFLSLSGLSASSGNVSFGFLGTATIASLRYTSTGAKASTPTAALQGNATATASYAVTSSTTAVTAIIKVSGLIRVTSAGTIIPSVGMSVASAATVETNSYFLFEDLGSGTATASADIN